MLNLTRRALLAAAVAMPMMAGAASAEGLITIIVNDPANPYWFTEGEVAKRTAEELGGRSGHTHRRFGKFQTAIDLFERGKSRLRNQLVVHELIGTADLGRFQGAQRQGQLQSQLAAPLHLHAVGEPVDHAANRTLIDEVEKIAGGALSLAGDVSTVAIVTQTALPFAVILAVLMLGERLSVLRIAGIVAAFGGVVIIGFDPRVFGYGTAVVMVLLASFVMALAQVLMRGLKNVAIFNLQAWIAVTSAPSLLGLSLLVESNHREMMRTASWAAWGNLAFTAFGSSLLGFAGMYYLLRRYPVSLVTPMFLLAPIFGIIGGVTLLGDVITLRVFLGAVVTLAGVLAVALAPGAKPAA